MFLKAIGFFAQASTSIHFEGVCVCVCVRVCDSENLALTFPDRKALCFEALVTTQGPKYQKQDDAYIHALSSPDMESPFPGPGIYHASVSTL